MREMEAALGSKTVKLRANFNASMQLMKRVGDPLMIAREGLIEKMMNDRGHPYDPKFKFTIENIPKMIYIGMNEYDSSVTEQDVQALVFEAGFVSARDVATAYLSEIIGPAPKLGDNSTSKVASDGAEGEMPEKLDGLGS